MTVAHKFEFYYSLCPLRDGPPTRQNHFALYRRFIASATQVRAGEVQKDYSRKGKLNGKKFMYAN